MIYKYKGFNAKGRKEKGKIEAVSMEEVKLKLKARSILYESISEDSPSFLQSFQNRRASVIPAKVLINLSREIAAYIRSGMTIVSTTKLLGNQYKDDKRTALFLSTVGTYLDEGKSFHAALDAQNIYTLPHFYKQSVKVSEERGVMEVVLVELARFMKEQERLNKEVGSALFYPGFMILVALGAISFMFAVVVPRITDIFKQMKQDLPPITEVVIGIGDFMGANFQFIGIVLVVFVIAFTYMMKNVTAFKYGVDKLALKVPLFGDIIQKSELGRFAYMNALLIRSGVPMVQSINLSSQILKNSVISGILQKAAKKVVEGSRLSVALVQDEDVIGIGFIQSIALGEETSNVPDVLSNMAELYFEDNKDKIGILLSLMEPMLMLMVGGVIGAIVIAMLLPIFSMNVG
ncbi:type II secretion system F family protein [Sulfurimonas sp. MAG313]|nr:type II secretion system F family protein [Sulfurimonas sp. MAG313]MDF1881903.1 type II secretion system F family protein [Sulfurimonas sp. MAG313]